MYHMVLLIVNDLDRFPDVLDAWEVAQLPGITILESIGLGKIRRAALREDLPLMPNLADLFASNESHHRTLFTVVQTEEKVDEIIAITRKVLGDLEAPGNGVLFVLPVSRVVGLRDPRAWAKKG